MILSLLLATVIFIPVVAIVGILPIGSNLFGDNSFNIATANFTVHTNISQFGPVLIGSIFLIFGGALTIALIESLKKSNIHKKLNDFAETEFQPFGYSEGMT